MKIKNFEILQPEVIIEPRKYYVYVYLDPRKNGDYKYGEYEFEHEPFYVGKGTDNRWKEHLSPSIKKINPFKYRKIQKIIRETGNIPIIIKYRNELTEKESLQLEIKMIKIIGRKDLKTGPLVNMSDGGETCNRRTIPKNVREKIRKTKTGTHWGHHTEDTKKELSRLKMGIVFSDEHKSNLSKARKTRIITNETRKKCSQTSKGKINIKIFTLISPNGKEYITNEGLTKFCEEHNLFAANFYKIIKGKRKHHKGWSIKI